MSTNQENSNLFKFHKKSKYVSINCNKNIDKITLGSHIKILFTCDICNHEFEAIVKDVIKGQWCPYCATPSRILCNNIDCNSCLNKSFQSHEKAKYWSLKNETIPRNIFLNTNKKYIFDCNKCNHAFSASCLNVNYTFWCPYCANQKLCNNVECIECYNKSFATNEKSKFWSIKNEINPKNVFKNANKKYLFDCDVCNSEFNAKLNMVNGSNTWCPYCKNKTELKLYNQLIKIYPNINRQFKVEWCKNKSFLPFDFVILEYKIIIELDGEQHFKQISNWENPIDIHKMDIYKMKCANNNKFCVIRILQLDVCNDNFDWLNEIMQAIIKLIKENIIQNIFICKNNIYDIFIKN